jgi:hypothetical protein
MHGAIPQLPLSPSSRVIYLSTETNFHFLLLFQKCSFTFQQYNTALGPIFPYCSRSTHYKRSEREVSLHPEPTQTNTRGLCKHHAMMLNTWTGSSLCFKWLRFLAVFSSYLQINKGISPQITPRPVPPRSLPIHYAYSLVMLPFCTTQSGFVKASLCKL